MNDFSSGNIPEPELKQKPVRNLALERLQIASPMLAVASVILTASVVQGVLHLVLSTLAPDVTDAPWYRQVIAMAPMYLFAMPLSLLLFGLSKSVPPARQKLKPAVWLGLLAVCFGMTYAGNYLGVFVNAIISAITGTPTVNELEQLTMSTPLWSNLLFVGILAPIMEEIFYRKLVIDRLRRYGELPAILISGIGFGLLHGNFSQFFYAAAIGIVFGYIYLRTGNILHTIGLHMVINLVGGVYATEVYRMLDVELMQTDALAAFAQSPVGTVMYLVYMAFFAISCIAAILSAILLMLYWFRKPVRAEHPLTRGEWVRVLILNPGVWIFLLVVAMLFLL
ncbi:MAG: CPBP family intramembrane metalloprotease [Clostridia bacterium]|nr:CPBP family intramembrane metalloprotease [Clostridia bacterium]